MAIAATAATPSGGDPSLEWLELTYDFGTFHEAGGTQTGKVRFINRSDKPTVITRVRPSCGCTGADYPTDPIAPGDTAIVSFSYNPSRRPGSFEKTVKVFTGAESLMSVIVIKGTVIGTPATLEKDYPIEASGLRMSTGSVDVGKVASDGARHSFVRLYNSTSHPIAPTATSSDKALDITIKPETIPPGETGTVSLYLNPRLIKDCGSYSAEVRICPGKEKGSTMTILYKADIYADTSRLSAAQIAEGPRADILPATFSFEDISPGTDPEFSFEMTNVGKSRLEIRRTDSTGPVEIKRRPAHIRPGKSAKITGRLKTSEMPAGPFRIEIEIISNDTLHPRHSVYLAGNILTVQPNNE